jgi:hypothetical protein
MTMIIKDANSINRSIQSTEYSGEHIPHHKITNGLSNDGKAYIMTTYANDGSVQGIGHNLNNVIIIPATTTINFLMDLSSVVDKYVFILPMIFNTSSESVDVRVYENTDYTGGTSVPTYNVNRNMSDTTQFVITSGATGVSKGTKFRHNHITANKYSGGESKPVSFIILNNSYNYLVEIENASNNHTYVEYDVTIFES